MHGTRDRRPTRFASLTNPGRYFFILAAVLSVLAGLSYAFDLL